MKILKYWMKILTKTTPIIVAFFGMLFIGTSLFTFGGFIDLGMIHFEELITHFIVISICVFLIIFIYESL